MRRITIVRALPALCIGVTLTGIWLGCADEAPSLTVAQGCSLSSECQSPLVCAFAKCHQACKSSRDCTKGERCVQSDRPYYVCQKQSCSRNSDCLGKQVCAQDGQCHDECLTQKDCLADQVCTAGACADTSELVNGALPNNAAGDGGDGTGQRCTLPTDCPGDLVCLRGGVCGAECIGDKDCRKTYVCKPVRAGGPGRCFPDAPASIDGGLDATSDATLDASDAADSGQTQGGCGLGDIQLGEFATWVGKVNVHRPTGGVWEVDADCATGGGTNTLEYCKKFWPSATGLVHLNAVTPENKPFTQAGGQAPTCGGLWLQPGVDQYSCCRPQ